MGNAGSHEIVSAFDPPLLCIIVTFLRFMYLRPKKKGEKKQSKVLEKREGSHSQLKIRKYLIPDSLFQQSYYVNFWRKLIRFTFKLGN